MQLKPPDSSTSVPVTEASESRIPTTQDGIHPPAPSPFDKRCKPRSRRLSRDSVAAETNPSARGVGAAELDKSFRRLSLHEGHGPVPGERISAYENATPPTGQHIMCSKITKRSGSPSDGPVLTDCPNGMLSAFPW